MCHSCGVFFFALASRIDSQLEHSETMCGIIGYYTVCLGSSELDVDKYGHFLTYQIIYVQILIISLIHLYK